MRKATLGLTSTYSFGIQELYKWELMLLLKSNITFWKGTRPNPSFNTTMIWRNINRLNFWICKLGKEKKTTEKNHYSDLPYKRKQIVEKFQNLFCAGVTEDRISSGCITHHKSPSFGLFYISGPASSFHNTQNAIHTKAHLQKNTEMKGQLFFTENVNYLYN